MDNSVSLSLARIEKAKWLEAVRYQLDWRGGGEPLWVRLYELKTMLGLSLHTVECYISRGRGSFSIKRPNPVTGEDDILTVTRINPPAKPKKLRGRPPKYIPDWERLGSEAPGSPIGTELASLAKTPKLSSKKRANRRTDDNRLKKV